VPRSLDVTGGDGTVVRARSDDSAGDDRQPAAADDGGVLPLLLLGNGLGTVAETRPGRVAADSGDRTVTWYHRGTFGSARPADPSGLRTDDHVDDAVAVLDVLDERAPRSDLGDGAR
jgi:hypothetical protein